MKLLLTSGGITNDTIERALAELVGKPFNEIKIGFIPTAALGEASNKTWLIMDMHRLVQRGAWVDIFDIAHMSKSEILERLEPVDVVFVGGGNTYYLSYCMEKSGLYELLPELLQTKVYAGISAGSMIMGSTIRVSSSAMLSEKFYDKEYDEFGPAGRSSARTFGAVDFAIRPHLGSEKFANITQEKIQLAANELQTKIYAIDDQTAIVSNGDKVTVVSEGIWKIIEPK